MMRAYLGAQAYWLRIHHRIYSIAHMLLPSYKVQPHRRFRKKKQMRDLRLKQTELLGDGVNK